ncbi:peroxidase family protein [Acidimangrovimonas sediminis]|uniref:peroxidase family protein n=1 Tax=Acidimangrovimonas sediminis TaxID=2056283 RepID=UPI000C80D1DB|nr:peroxidase family protein [Acidimangrovimonas sediminis]
MIKLANADLNYLLQQANILNDYSRLTSALDPNGVREVSGSNNNLVGGYTVNADGSITWTGTTVHPDWGQADTDFLRLFPTNNPAEDAYGTSYATVQKTWIDLDKGDGTFQSVLVDNPMAFDPALLTTDRNGLNPGDSGYQPTFVYAPAEYQYTDTATTMDQSSSVVVDPMPRMISELIASSNVDTSDPNHNPAAVAAMENLGGAPVGVSNSVVGDITTAFMPNPGILGGVTYNEWFVAFGQFFDHGLDFIQKTGGVVMIPLSPNDPLWVDPTLPDGSPNPAYIPGASNVMMLARGKLANPDSDFDADGNLLPGVVPVYNNNTGLLIDQSQTYGSHESVNVLVRQYGADGHVTGQLITGAEDGDGSAHDLGTWADMKVNAARIGVELRDMDVLDCPWIKADAIGRLGFAAQQDYTFRSDQSIADLETEAATTGITINGVTYTSYADIDAAGYDPFLRWTLDDALAGRVDVSQVGEVRTTNQAILIDIAHGAAPGLTQEGNELSPLSAVVGAGPGTPGTYDDALLARHKVSGDGRVNENVTLTTVHHVFHEEHNIQARQLMVEALRDAYATGDLTMLNGDGTINDFSGTGYGWLNTAITLAALDGLDTMADDEVLALAQTFDWDGEKVYQAARVVVESEYNHIAIDQYMGTLYPALPEFVSYSTDIDLSISLEFAQAVFRLGHSQLRETVQIAVTDAHGIDPGEPGYTATYTENGLFDAFLNPDAYDMYGAAGIAAGLLTQQGNEMDEFVTAALQQSLVGVPLDLPALNIARGRDVGMPSLNELRQEVFDGLMQNTSNNANGSGIAPYHSWADFGAHLRTPESLVNFIAAYGRDDDTGHTFGLQAAREAYLDGSGELYEIRAVAQHIVDAAADPDDPDHAAALKFVQGTSTGEPTYIPPTGTKGDPGYVPGHWDVNAASGDQGFWDIDLWIGGLAEQALFDGPLGTTFSFILLDFAQRLQDGDRFYYLYRMPVGQHLGDQIIGEQFADLVMRTTGLEHIPDAFGTPSAVYTLDGTNSAGDYIDNARDGVGAGDAYGDNDYFNATLESLPDVTSQVVLSNGSFEAQDLVAAGATTNARGTYLSGTIQDWTLVGSGGTWAPTTAAVPFLPDGSQVAQLGTNSSMTADTGTTLVEGATYTLNLRIGDKIGYVATAGIVKLVAADGTVLASQIFNPPLDDGDVTTDDAWDMLTLTTGPVAAAAAGLGLSIVIETDGSGQNTLFDAVTLSVTEPGGSANDGHIVVIGLSGDDFIVGALGDDVLYGDEGNDVLEGAQGNDHLYGGDGDDYITDYENDDFIAGGAGNDTIFAGPGVLDTAHGNEGDDEVHGGDGIDEVFGDDGNDRLYGEGDTDLMIGGDGDDYMDGGDSVDEMFGGNGNDWMRGGVGDDNINGGSGNDLLEGGLGATANDGDRLNGDSAPGTLPVIEYNGDGSIGEMDIASYEEVGIAIVASLQTSNGAGTSSSLLDTYAMIDGLVGSRFDDILEGGGPDAIALNGSANQLIGGAGNDRLTGLGDDDIIVGDWAIVRGNLHIDIDATTSAAGYTTIANWFNTGEDRPVFDDTGETGHILGDNGAAGTGDVSVYRGAVSNYAISGADNGVVTVADTRDAGVADHDGTDMLIGIEKLDFAGDEYNLVLGTAGADTGAGAVDGDNDNATGVNTQDILLGLGGDDLLRGYALSDILIGGTGNDTVNAGGGNDTIVWQAGDGRDLVNGQGGGSDTFVVRGDGAVSEVFGIYTAAAAVSSNVPGAATLNPNTEIVVTRMVAGTTEIIAELRNVEELVFSGYGGGGTLNNGQFVGGDQFVVVGDFTGTSLAYNTIHIEGGDGDDTVDITGLTSSHRIDFVGRGGENMVVGDYRPQDVVENAHYAPGGGAMPPGQGPAPGSTVGDGCDDAAEGGAPEGDAPEVNASAQAAAGEIIAGEDTGEVLIGTDGTDQIFAGGGADKVFGLDGGDMLFGDAGDDRIFGGDGDDLIDAGTGDDMVLAGEGDDIVLAGEDDGNDSYWGGDGIDTLDYSAATSDLNIDLGSGLMGHGQVAAWTGTDQIYGFENVMGGSGDDRITANAEVNVMDGGAGDDTFVFGSAAAADGDMIAGFAPGDRIDLAGIDADRGTDGNQSFVIYVAGGFSAAGQLSIVHELRSDGDHTLVSGNVDDDLGADFEIDLIGYHDLTSTDFNGVH